MKKVDENFPSFARLLASSSSSSPGRGSGGESPGYGVQRRRCLGALPQTRVQRHAGRRAKGGRDRSPLPFVFCPAISRQRKFRDGKVSLLGPAFLCGGFSAAFLMRWLYRLFLAGVTGWRLLTGRFGDFALCGARPGALPWTCGLPKGRRNICKVDDIALEGY